MSGKMQSDRRVKVWDLPTRLFHWLLVILLIGLYATAQLDMMDQHMVLGYAVLTLTMFRLAWGFVGSPHSRFAAFLAGPGRTCAYLKSLFGGTPVPVIGHNPLGGWMVILLLAAVLVQASTGLFTTDDILTEGPLSGKVSSATSAVLSSIHRNGFNVLLALICLHVAAALFYRFVKRDDLITPMVTGWKSLPAGPSEADQRTASTWLALALLAISALIVWAIVAQQG